MSRISVCVPHWKRPDAIHRMLARYGALYPDMDLEFSVCDDGSPDTPDVPPSVILTVLPRKDGPLNPCVPINRAVAASTGDVIVITNPEIEHEEPILGEMLGLLDGPDAYVVARCWDMDREMWLADASVDYTKNGRAPVPPGGHFHFLAMLHRELWERAGGFDEDYRHLQGHDDNDWLWRLHRAGARFRLTEGHVLHRHTHVSWGLPSGRATLREKWSV